MKTQHETINLNRRGLMTSGCAFVGGMAFAGLPGAGFAAEDDLQRSHSDLDTHHKNVRFPPKDATDPAIVSPAEVRFWAGIMAEHAGFLVALSPGPELASARRQGQKLQREFQTRLRQAQQRQTSFSALNRAMNRSLAGIIEFKSELLEKQLAGRIHTLAWPSLIEHMIQEATRTHKRLEQLTAGVTGLDPQEVITFWADIMEEHAEFFAGFLDPKEKQLIGKARDFARRFELLEENPQKEEAETAVRDIIAFKTQGLNGIQNGTIRSMLKPSLAEHVRQEAMKFLDELERAGF